MKAAKRDGKPTARKVFCGFCAPLWLTVLAATAFAQTSTDKISANEAAEAVQLARTFSTRLQRTKDITPLIDAYFVNDFINGYVQDHEEDWFIFLPRKVAKRLSRAQLRKYFIAELNWFYLCNLVTFSQYSSLSHSDIAFEKIYPADVLKLFLDDRSMRVTIKDEDHDESTVLIGSIARFRSFRNKLERANYLLRQHARRINAGETPPYRETMSDWSVRYYHYDPWLKICTQTCLTMPKGTRLIIVNVPSLQLQLARVNGRMQILSATYYLD
jgi:hypothetical protein